MSENIGKSQVNSWLFSGDPNRKYAVTEDPLGKERRKLIEMHRGGELTAAELQEELKKLKRSNDV